MLNYAQWPSWLQGILALLCLLIVGIVYWFAWFRPATETFRNWSPRGKKLLLASVVGATLVTLIWVGISAFKN